MHAQAISRLGTGCQQSPAALEASLLELFAPTRARRLNALSTSREGHARLWRADAIHRAKNMAQMTMSLANVADDPSRQWLPPELVMQARRLSRAYEELGVDDDAELRLPCAGLLAEIAARLGDIFGRSRLVAIKISAAAISLPPDVRRALVLTASELIINALKYGYAAEAGGTIMVSLTLAHDTVDLIVEDDGTGRVEDYRAGQGGGLLGQLGTVLGATMTRACGAKGHGFRVAVSMPIDKPRANSL